MARKLRLQYPGAVYHVMNRGDRRELIFQDDTDRKCFIDTLGEACVKTGWQLHAWCLMPNHFHLVMATPQPNLSAGMKWLLAAYTGRYNRRHKQFGHLFSGRYKALIVDASGNGYLKTVCDYVHLNPVRAKMLRAEQSLAGYPWNSLRFYLQPARKRPSWLQVSPLLGEHGIPGDTPAGRREFARRMETRRNSENETKDYKTLRRGWFLGDKAFKKELLAQMKEPIGEHHFGEERAATEQEHAEAVVREGLRELRWRETDLARHRKGAPQKVRLAQRLRTETTMTLKWIAERLQMGSWTTLNALLYRQRRKHSKQ